MKRLLILVLLTVCSTAVLAVTDDLYPLASESDRERFHSLTKELRCPKCQNQNISDSNSPIARDMKDEVHRMVREGASNEEIFEALVSRFGEFVRYKPQFDKRTALLWATPLIVILLGGLLVMGVVVRSRRNSETSSGLTEAQREKAKRILGDHPQDRTGDSSAKDPH
ncbi:cytochrome c-type biogenesis protein [Marinobacter caseinilyticus]|uniref:cytochrome c-type biogenesis protein n=1 Tax=Marinobacter caseinilyticus TaxID=2692195 RepID=UPI00140B80F5|nr:cytochrome c-type biogenesis protein [Marinobacter caseinilyticus]